MEGIDAFVKIGIFVKILAQCKEGQKFRSLEVRGKLIALKNLAFIIKIQTTTKNLIDQGSNPFTFALFYIFLS